MKAYSVADERFDMSSTPCGFDVDPICDREVAFVVAKALEWLAIVSGYGD
jgi:hypothetical protein